jgi:hypothetical protein
MDTEPLLRELYDAFNAHNVDLLLGELSPDVDWPNAWQGGRLHGHQELRDYWNRQFAEFHPQVEAGEITARPDGTIAVAVHQTVRGLDGTLLSEGDVVHVYTFEDGLITRMDVEEPL